MDGLEAIMSITTKPPTRTSVSLADGTDYRDNFASNKNLPEKVDERKQHGKASPFSNTSLLSTNIFTEAEQTSGLSETIIPTTNFIQDLVGKNFIPNLSSQNHSGITDETLESTQSISVASAQNLQRLPSPTRSNPNDTSSESLKSPLSGQDPLSDNGTKNVIGSASKRIRRKCTFPDCNNRVVQGGLCISHGAKRKTCGHPGCTKNVKKAGMCSAHGPARKRCEFPDCGKVSVQGGKCIAHGAKKKLCSLEDCTKQAIFSGMCKKHHDQMNGVTNARNEKKSIARNNGNHDADQHCIVIPRSYSYPQDSGLSEKQSGKKSHRRGLSIFQDMNTVDSNLAQKSGGSESSYLSRNESSEEVNIDHKKVRKPLHRRGLSLFVDDDVADSIIRNPSIIE